MQKLNIVLYYFSFENIAAIIKEHLHKAIGALILLVGLIFCIVYFVNERQSNIQKLVGSYVMSANYFSQNDSILALRHAQDSYNNSKGTLEVASLMQVTEILFTDNQYAKIFDILADVVSSKHKPENALLLYNYTFNTLHRLEQHNFDKTKIMELTKEIQNLTEKTQVAKNYLPHKVAFLLELNAITELKPQSYYISQSKSGSSNNEMQNVLNAIGDIYK
jgi:hypothetical protein